MKKSSRELRVFLLILLLAVSITACGDNGGGGGGGGFVSAGLRASISGPANWSTDTGFLNTLDGSSSSDALTYIWSIQSKPAGSTHTN